MAYPMFVIVGLSFWLSVAALLGCLIYWCRKPAGAGAAGRSGASSEKVCAICLGVMAARKECSEVPACRHVFHRTCIARWMESKSTCPLCREPIAPAAAAGDIA